MSNFPVQDFLYKHLPGPYMMYHTRKTYGFEWRWILRAWRESKAGGESILGGTLDKVDDFMDKVIQRDHESNVNYRCIFGTCTVIWHPKRGYIGGFGAAGCQCDDMEDPRDLQKGPI